MYIKNQKKQHSLHNLQRGMSLVELMISMVVGLFLLAGVVTNFISTKDADIKRTALSEMDANANVVFQTLRQSIAHAGYQGIDNIILDKPFFTKSDLTDGAENSTCGDGSNTNIWTDSIDQPTKDYGNRDQITVVYRADNPCNTGLTSCSNAANRNPAALVYYDCTGGGADTSDSRVVSCSTDSKNGGMTDPTKSKIYNSFTLLRNISSPNDRVLYCQGSRGGKEPIATDVEAIQYLYGVTDDNDNTFYRTANQVETAEQWGMVTSVQVGLLMRSSHQYVLDQASTKKEYFLLKKKVKIADADLHRLFKVYTTTINLENIKTGEVM